VVAKHARLLKSQLSPIISRAILGMYLEKKKNVVPDLRRDSPGFIGKPEDGVAKFVQLVNDVTQFAVANGITDTRRHASLARQLHSEFCRNVPLSEFLEQPLVKKAVISPEGYEQVLGAFLRGQHSETLTQLFQQPDKFNDAIKLLNIGLTYGTPLERLEQCELSVVILKDVHLYEEGVKAPAVDIQLMFQFALIMAKLPNLVGMTKYIQAFVKVDDEAFTILTKKEKKRLDMLYKAVDEIKRLVH
jgi:hypothetical protein